LKEGIAQLNDASEKRASEEGENARRLAETELNWHTVGINLQKAVESFQ
jgi:hypothetical protein